MPGTLYMVATPIGNLEDVTFRAVRVLKEVSAVACEDTRVTRKLLQHLGIGTPMVALHEHSDERALERLVARLEAGESLAYVSDAGTPGVNDPGGKLVEFAFARGLAVVPVPGPSALSAAISVCGFPMDDFTYLGFVPHKKGRETFFKDVAARETPSVFFESTHRMEKTMEALAMHLAPGRRLFIGRELTKLHETLYRGTVDEVRAALQATSWKGEFVVIIGRA